MVYFHLSFVDMCEFISKYMIGKAGDGLKIMKGVIIRIYLRQNLKTAFSFFY